MKKLLSVTLVFMSTLVNPAAAQMTEVDADMVEGLRQLVLNDGKNCAIVTDLQPENATTARLTCKANESGNRTVVYLIQVDDNGLVITEE